MAHSSAPPPPRGDEAQLFREFNDDLMRLLAGNVRSSSPQTVEDACAFAWTKFMEHQPDRDQNWRGWLFRTGVLFLLMLSVGLGLAIRAIRDADAAPERTRSAAGHAQDGTV